MVSYSTASCSWKENILVFIYSTKWCVLLGYFESCDLTWLHTITCFSIFCCYKPFPKWRLKTAWRTLFGGFQFYSLYSEHMEKEVSSLLKADAKQFSYKDTCESNQLKSCSLTSMLQVGIAGEASIVVYCCVVVLRENDLRGSVWEWGDYRLTLFQI